MYTKWHECHYVSLLDEQIKVSEETVVPRRSGCETLKFIFDKHKAQRNKEIILPSLLCKTQAFDDSTFGSQIQ